MAAIRISDLFNNTAIVAAGATLGEEHFRRIVELAAPNPKGNETVVVLDFTGIDDATPSYIKATVLTLHQSGRRFSNTLTSEEHEELGAIAPLNILVILTGLTAAVQDCVHEVFARRSLAIFSGEKWENNKVINAVLLGRVEPAALEALEACSGFEEFQASDLLAGSKITVTGWNNRLAELYRQRLLRRRVEGRTNRFGPLATNFKAYGQVLLGK